MAPRHQWVLHHDVVARCPTKGEGCPKRVLAPIAVVDAFQASQPKAIAWVADGMQYQVGGAFSTDELVSLAELLR